MGNAPPLLRSLASWSPANGNTAGTSTRPPTPNSISGEPWFCHAAMLLPVLMCALTLGLTRCALSTAPMSSDVTIAPLLFRILYWRSSSFRYRSRTLCAKGAVRARIVAGDIGHLVLRQDCLKFVQVRWNVRSRGCAGKLGQASFQRTSEGFQR